MTVSTTTSRAAYSTNGTTGPFTVPFYFLDDEHLLVTYVTGGVSTTLVLTTDYTVTGAGDPNGGAITLVSSLPAGGTITIVRDVPATQLTDYVNLDAFPAESHERALDKLTMIAQQQDEVLNRALVFPVGDETDGLLPSAADRANTLQGYDATGAPAVYELDLAASQSFSHADSNPAGTVGGRLAQTVSAEDAPFNAAGDGVADDAAAVQAALDFVGAAGGGTVLLPRGTFLLSQTLVFNYPNTALVGAGGSGENITISGGTFLRATHSAGAVVWVKKSGCKVADLVLGSSAARYAGAAGTNWGLRVEAADASNEFCKRTYVARVRVTQQPSHGVVGVSDLTSSRFDMVDVDNVDGVGFYFNSGTLTARVNKTRVGQVQLDNCRASRTGGNSLVLGGLNATETTTDDIPYRFQIDNFEAFYNCLDAATRLNTYNAIVFGENHEIRCSAFGGYDLSAVDSFSGVWLAGKFNVLENNRYVDCLTYVVNVQVYSVIGSEDNRIVGGYINNSNKGAGHYNPAVLVASTAVNTHVEFNTTNTDVSSVATPTPSFTTANFRGVRRFNGVDVSGAFRSIYSEVSLSDDKAAYIEFNAACRGVAVISGNTSSAAGCVVNFRCGDGSAFVTGWGAPAAVAFTTGTLGGTTGVDTNLTVSADTATNRLYIENRTGGARSYCVTFLSIAGDNHPTDVINLP